MKGPITTAVDQPCRLPKGSRHGGFTLVEVLVAGLLLILVLIPVLGAYVSSVQVAVKAETENTATLLAQEQIEEMRGMNYATLMVNSDLITTETGITGSGPYEYDYEGTTYEVAADSGGAVDPVDEDVERRNATYTVNRYVLWVDDPTDNATAQDYKKVVVEVSWIDPQPGSLTFETDIEQIGFASNRPPTVVPTFPYIGDAFYSTAYISDATATAYDPDGTPQNVLFQYKKNIDASFSNVGTDTTGTDDGQGGYEFSVTWSANLTSEQQYNFRAIVEDDDGNTAVSTHPFFIDPSAPLPPSTISLEGSDGGTDSPLVWPPVLEWSPVDDFIGGNSNYNMVVGYYLYRDVRPVGDTDEPESSTPLAVIHGSDVSRFTDVIPLPDGVRDQSSEIRYRLESMGRAEYWRDPSLGRGSLEGISTGWSTVDVPDTGSPFSTFDAHEEAEAKESGAEVLATPTGWSAVTLTWLPQTDDGGNRADLYLVYRDEGGEGDDYALVGTLADDDPTATELIHRDRHLSRNTTYRYELVPVFTGGYPDSSSAVGTSNLVTTRLY